MMLKFARNSAILFCLNFHLVPSFSYATNCETEFAGLEGIGHVGKMDIARTRALLESHSLEELITSDPNRNLAVRHPMILSNAAQRVYYALTREATTHVYEGGFDRTPKLFVPVLQRPLEANNGKFIIGNHGPVTNFFEQVKSVAEGDGASSKTITLVGGSGTGKTRFLEIVNQLLTHQSYHDPKAFMYSFEWTNLEQIPELWPLIPKTRDPHDPKNVIFLPLRPSIYEPVIALLPPAKQQEVLQLGRDNFRKTTNLEPAPFLALNPQSQFIRDHIIAHYAKQARSADSGSSSSAGIVSENEIVNYLSKHVRIVRYLPSSNALQGFIPYQGKDIDWTGLGFTENALIKANYGAGHPFSYHYSGTIPQAQGLILLFDEFARNTSEFLNFGLNLQESRVLQIGGSTSLQLDMLIIAATNQSSMDKMKTDPDSHAQSDRLWEQQMRGSIVPADIQHVMLTLKGASNFQQRPLGYLTDTEPEEANKFSTANLDQLFPDLLERRGTRLTPAKRYALRYSSKHSNDAPVLISPHTLEFISWVVSASRMITDTSLLEANGLGGLKVGQSHLFADPIHRLKALIGLVEITDAQAADLDKISKTLKEGDGGISTRDAASIWLTQVLNTARRPGYEQTVTPLLAKQVLEELFRDDAIKPVEKSKQLEILTLADQVAVQLIIPGLKQDIATAIASRKNNLEAIYDTVFTQFQALALDPEAVTYSTPSGADLTIPRKKLKRIMEIYQEQQGSSLSIQHLINISKYPSSDIGHNRRFHPGLMNAIQTYYADASFETLSFESLSSAILGSSEDHAANEAADEILKYMEQKLGYNAKSVRDAFELTNSQFYPRSK